MSEPSMPYSAHSVDSEPSGPTVDVQALRAAAAACWEAIQKARCTAPDTRAPWGVWAETRHVYQFAVDDPRVVLALLDRIEALEKALEFAEVGRDAFQEMWQHGREAVRLMEEQSERDCAARDQAMIAAGELATSLSQARAALGREEASRE